jgi:hypothetical protein
VERPSDLTSLFQLILPEDIDKSLETDENRDILISILNSYAYFPLIKTLARTERTAIMMNNEIKVRYASPGLYKRTAEQQQLALLESPTTTAPPSPRRAGTVPH